MTRVRIYRVQPIDSERSSNIKTLNADLSPKNLSLLSVEFTLTSFRSLWRIERKDKKEPFLDLLPRGVVHIDSGGLSNSASSPSGSFFFG